MAGGFCASESAAGTKLDAYFRARDGGGLEDNNAYNDVPWSVSDGGETWQSGNLHVGGAVFQTDGNVLLPFRNAWLSDVLADLYNRDNGKANAGARAVGLRARGI
jgi:hypothetical protein